MPFHFGDHPAQLGPACRLVGKIGVVPPDLVRRSSDRTLEQMADPRLENLVGRQADRIFDPLGLQELVDPGIAKAACVTMAPALWGDPASAQQHHANSGLS
jgi:hypothetical protein